MGATGWTGQAECEESRLDTRALQLERKKSATIGRGWAWPLGGPDQRRAL
jgi:hypothetical protein